MLDIKLTVWVRLVQFFASMQGFMKQEVLSFEPGLVASCALLMCRPLIRSMIGLATLYDSSACEFQAVSCLGQSHGSIADGDDESNMAA
ncbi:UBC core domain-containing protein [Psidium guajava]|nr:UBC core domain-containing protein [Psidium guajava]